MRFSKAFAINAATRSPSSIDVKNTPRSIVFAVNFRVLNELARCNIGLDALDCRKVVVNTIHFTGSGRTRRMRNRETELIIGEPLHE